MSASLIFGNATPKTTFWNSIILSKVVIMPIVATPCIQLKKNLVMDIIYMIC
jgi:hypothetical protein